MSTSLYLLPAFQTARPGDSIFVGLYTHSDQQLTGLDYSLDYTGCSMIGRNLTLSSFPDPVDNSLTGDLGASINDVSAPLSVGDHFVASYEFRIDGAANQVLIKPRAYPGTTGAVLGPPAFAEVPFSDFQGAVVTIAPEPSLIGLVLFALAVSSRKLFRRRNTSTLRS